MNWWWQYEVLNSVSAEPIVNWIVRFPLPKDEFSPIRWDGVFSAMGRFSLN